MSHELGRSSRKEVPYFVLVGGEHPDLGGAYGAWGIEHCSLKHIGQAYDRLRKHFPRSQIIVIAQLAETLAHLSKSAETGESRIAPEGSCEPAASRALWQFHRDLVRHACEKLLEEGGAQYDGVSVNAGTILSVLLGESINVAGNVVVPRIGCSSVHLAVYSHGDMHGTTALAEHVVPCDVCGSPHACSEFVDHEHESQFSQEWYLHMPHPSHRKTPELQWVAIENARRPEHYLYATQLRAALMALRQDRPCMPLCVLLNACRSGGALKWLRDLQTESWAKGLLRLHDWPILMISSCGATQDALVGGMWTAWFDQLDVLLQNGGDATLQDLYRLSNWHYLCDNSYDILNRVRCEARLRNPASTDEFISSMRAALLAPHGIDWMALKQLQEEHALHLPVMCLLCGDFRGAQDHQWLCSSCWRDRSSSPEDKRKELPRLELKPADLCAIVRDALAASAQPQECHGAESGIMGFTLSSL